MSAASWLLIPLLGKKKKRAWGSERTQITSEVRCYSNKEEKQDYCTPCFYMDRAV